MVNVKFTEGEKKDGVPVTLFTSKYLKGHVFYNKGKAVIYFPLGFIIGFLGQIAAILPNFIFYLQFQTGTAEEARICILGTSTLISFAEALVLAKDKGKTLAKVDGDVFTLPYMTKKAVEDFITKVFQLEHPDANMPNKDEYAKYNTVPVFTEADFTSVVPTSKVVEPTHKLGFTADSGSAGWANTTLKSVPTVTLDKKKEVVVLSDEANGKIELRAANVSLKKETVATLELKLAEIQAEIALAKEQVTKAESLLKATRENEIAKAVADKAARALEDLAAAADM